MAESIRLEQQELDYIAEVQQVSQNIVVEYGNIELSRKALDARMDRADEALETLRQNERDLIASLENKYGSGTLDLQQGIFTPSDDAPAPSPTVVTEEEEVEEEAVEESAADEEE